jgi:phosphopantothenoylcysteine decarboxylase/phosphopantothenate--cysteine ligase
MYDHPGVAESLAHLEQWGVTFADPRLEEGKAKIAGNDAIAVEVARATTPDPLAGKRVVVTAGATSERIDPVRVITNRASGRTGRAVARACYVRGAEVVLVHDGDEVPYAAVRSVETVEDVLSAALAEAEDADALVSAAAISDYTLEESDEKIRSGQELTLELEPTPKVIDEVRAAAPELAIVGFKLETSGDDDAMVAAARETRSRAGLAFVVANDASVMGDTGTRALLVEADETEEYAGDKAGLGGVVADRLAAVLGESTPDR